MKLPAKVEYACKAVIELALRYSDKIPVQLNTISEAQGIPRGFLLQLFIRLKNAGIVNSTRGISGGYFLTKLPSLITLADVFRAIDDNVIDKPKTARESGERIDAGRLIVSIWNKISSDVAQQLEHITIESLAIQIKNEQLTYCI